MKITLVSTMKNEGPYILEWIAYHRMIGVTDFVIFSNDCSDGSNLILNRLDTMGVISHFDNPLGPRMDPQRAAYSRANKMDDVQDSDYVLILDADEFLNVHCGDRSVQALIETCDDADAISVNWRLMGSGGASRMEDAPVIQRFTRGSSFDDPENGLVWGFKTLFRPKKFDFMGVHRPKFFKDRDLSPGMVRWFNGAGEDVGDAYQVKGWRSNKDTVGYANAQVNHYAIKSREEFLLKRLRGTANSKNKDRIDMGYWGKYDQNAHEDRTIRTEGLAEGIAALMADADLAALVRACHDNVARTIAYQMQDPKLLRFIETGIFTEDAA